jgi:hypothetical protein
VSVTGYVGLMGSGKTRQVVREGLEARKYGREVFANFMLGSRVRGYLVPRCSHWGCGHFDGSGLHERVNTAGSAADFSFEPATPVLDGLAVRYGWRSGLGFVSDPAVKVLTSWSQLEALRVHRDELGKVHRTKLIETGEDDDGSPTYTSARDCEVWNCEGCSKGITVLIDELNLWAPSRLWEKLGLGVLQRWAYARKDGLDIVWSAQHEARIDKVAREVTEGIWTNAAMGGSVRIRGGGLRVQIFRRQKFIPAMLNDKNRTLAAEGGKGGGLTDFAINFVVRFGAKLSTREEDAYDTFEHVQGSGHLETRSRPASAAAAGELIELDRRVSAPPRASGVRNPRGVTGGRSVANGVRQGRT